MKHPMATLIPQRERAKLSMEEKIYRMEEALTVARFSPDPSTQNGAVIVSRNNRMLGKGCNEFPNRVAMSEERWQRPLKYSFVEHAERNAIFDAATFGNALHGSVMICPWAACADCARAIVQTGIEHLVTFAASDIDMTRWAESIAIADSILDEAGVTVEHLDPKKLKNVKPLRRDGKEWTP